MPTHRELLAFQAHHHALVRPDAPSTAEDRALHLIHRKAYEEAAHLLADREVLDLGCNVGYGSRILARRARRVVGTDVSPRAIATARAQALPDNLDFLQTDGTRLPLPDFSFDAVLAFQVVEHVGIYTTFFAEINRVLRDDGLAIFTTPNAAGRLDRGQRPWNIHHVREFTAGELQGLLHIWYPTVRMRWLRATTPLREIELSRIRRARGRARNRVRAQFSRYVRRYLPASAMSTLRRSLNALRHDAPRSTAPMSLDNLFYDDHVAEDALDLMALCSKS